MKLRDGKMDTANKEMETSDTGIVRELGDMSSGTVVSEIALARMFKRSTTTIRRAVARGELPPPMRMFGGNAWTIYSLQEHFRKRLDDEENEYRKNQNRISNLRH